MSLITGNCIISNDDRKEIVAEQKGKKFTLVNDSKYTIRLVEIDGCIAQKKGEKRCDYLMSADGIAKPVVFFIELKGGALVDALRQLYESVVFLNQEFKSYVIKARVVGSRNVPEIKSSPEYRKLARKVMPKGDIIIRTNKFFSENI